MSYLEEFEAEYRRGARREMERERAIAMQRAMISSPTSTSPFSGGGFGIPEEFLRHFRGEPPEPEEKVNQKTLTLIKKSIKEIKTDAVSEEANTKIFNRIDRLEKLGLKRQAEILEVELSVRQKLNHLSEWDYKVLPFDAIKKFAEDNKMTATKDGLAVHIDLLETYIGTKTESEATEKLVPDSVLDELEKAKDRALFDTFSILWVEKVKDPLLLGQIHGCKDFFLIAEWGEDVKFNDILKGK